MQKPEVEVAISGSGVSLDDTVWDRAGYGSIDHYSWWIIERDEDHLLEQRSRQ
jgi:hypothetical protein